MTSWIALVTGGAPYADADVWRVSEPDAADQFYFCCRACGNCGKHRRLLETAAGEAALHVNQHGGSDGS